MHSVSVSDRVATFPAFAFAAGGLGGLLGGSSRESPPHRARTRQVRATYAGAPDLPQLPSLLLLVPCTHSFTGEGAMYSSAGAVQVTAGAGGMYSMACLQVLAFTDTVLCR